jgi:hypothetical protein
MSCVAQGHVVARHSRVRLPLRAMRPAAENSRSRLGSQVRAVPSRARICIHAVSSPATATSSHQTLVSAFFLRSRGSEGRGWPWPAARRAMGSSRAYEGCERSSAGRWMLAEGIVAKVITGAVVAGPTPPPPGNCKPS